MSRLTHRVAGGVLAMAALFVQPLPAQGDVEMEAAARRLLRTLVGTWRFEIRFAGNVDGAPDASGTHVVTALFDDLRVEWFEVLDHSRLHGRGIIGFDPGAGRFYSVAIYSVGHAPELMWGTLDDAEPLIIFSPIAVSPSDSPQVLDSSAALQSLDQDHFTWVALNRGWRAVFTRRE